MKIDNPDYIINIDDLASNFWKHTYIVSVTAQGITFLVNADCEGDALDLVMDYCVDHSFKGLYSEEYDENDDYITAGNFGHQFTTFNIHIDEV